MDGGMAPSRKFRITIRSVLLVIGGCVALSIPAVWTTQQSRLAHEALDRAIAAEKAAQRAQADAEQARTGSTANSQPVRDNAVTRAGRRPRNTKDEERIRKLYQEIDNLSRIQEHIEQDLWRLRSRSSKGGAPGEAGAP